MAKFDKIVLNIPHSSIGGLALSGWDNPIGLVKNVNKWTDWFTDLLFCSKQHGVETCVFNLSRFVCDVERLIDDPLESIGQGIIYKSFDDTTRIVENIQDLRDAYQSHINMVCNALTPRTLLIDCHSFPSDLSDIDVCIGFNNDRSKPDDFTLRIVKTAFECMGYRIGINTPYSNSLSPHNGFDYPSIMIELNKKVYMDESSLTLHPGFLKVKTCIELVYGMLLCKETLQERILRYRRMMHKASNASEQIMLVAFGQSANPFAPINANFSDIVRILATYGKNGYVVAMSDDPIKTTKAIVKMQLRFLPLHKSQGQHYKTFFVIFAQRRNGEEFSLEALQLKFHIDESPLFSQPLFANPLPMSIFTDHMRRHGMGEVLIVD